MAETSPEHRRRHARIFVAGFTTSLVIETALALIGLAYVFIPQPSESIALLIVWCVIGTVYAVVIAAILREASTSAESDKPPLVLELSLAPRIVSLVATILVSAVGVTAAAHHIFRDPDREGVVVEGVGVWAMLLAWMLLHWFFAKLYLQLYYREKTPPLGFPQTSTPGILEFAYFSYTIAVSLAVSDVEVRDRRMRLRVLTHAVLGFFFNGSIIVIAFGAIAQAGAFVGRGS